VLDPLVLSLVSFAFGLLFLVGALHKLAALGEFREVLAGYRLVPNGWIPAAAFGIGVAEAVIGIGWLFADAKIWPALATIGLLTVYATGMAVNLARGRTHISCGCSFGPSTGRADLLSWGLVGRNVVLALTAGLAMLPVSERDYGALDVFTLAAAVLVCVLLFAASNQLIRNRAAISAWRRPVPRHD
jgi:hypothetical protein